MYVPKQMSSTTLHFFKGDTIWIGVVGPVMSVSSHRFLLIFFPVTEDIVLIEIMK